jgi:SNF2 family DNA or RNA helicase
MLNREQLHEYQHRAVDFIIREPMAYLALACGLGKTATALTAIHDLMFDYFDIRKVLVVCPLRVGAVWREEIEKWQHLSGLKCAIAIGTESERKAALMQKADIYILNRENVKWFVEDSGLSGKIKFDMLVVDESSSFKDHTTKRFKAIMKIRPRLKRVLLLSATPAANSLLSLWSQFRLLDLGQRLGRFIGQYRTQFFVPDKQSAQRVFSYKPRQGAEKEIFEKISDIMISMTATDYLQMPELITVEHKVVLSEVDWLIYNKLKEDMILTLPNGEISAANAAVLSGKLIQLANGAIYNDFQEVIEVHNRKLDKLEDIVEAQNNRPILVAYWYQHDRDRIKKRFPNAVQIDSEKTIANWNADKIEIGLIHPGSCGHGLNLQQSSANAIVWFSQVWSLELFQQTTARLWRQGQKSESIILHHIVSAGTIDEQVMRALREKDMTQSALIEAVKVQL